MLLQDAWAHVKRMRRVADPRPEFVAALGQVEMHVCFRRMRSLTSCVARSPFVPDRGSPSGIAWSAI